jgi:hypothetical protein
MAGAKRKGSICLRTSMTQGEIRLVMGKTVSIILHFSENFLLTLVYPFSVVESPVHGDHGTPTPSASSSLISLEVSDWLRSMYEDVFEQVFGSWLGNYSCPFS